MLARCAAETIRLFYRHALQEPRGTPGIVTSIQTFGNQAANYHPHIHCCSYTSAYDHREHIERLPALELIARLATDIPGRYERLVRYYGVYSSRSRGARRARADGPERAEIEEKSPPAHLRRQWPRLLSRVFGVTLTCPTCEAGMKIMAVITEQEPVHKILAHLKSRRIDPRAGPFAERVA